MEEKLIEPGLKPGDYVAVIQVDLEEENGIPHTVYHMAPIVYLMNKAMPPDPSLTLELTSPEFNKKAFWDRKGDIELHIRNEKKEKMILKTRLFLPDGLRSPRPEATMSLEPESEQIQRFALQLTGSNETIFPYHIVAWYENEHLHHSRLLTGKIITVERPVYFKWFVLGSGALLLGILFLFTIVRFITRRHREMAP